MSESLNIITTDAQTIYDNTIGALETQLNEPLYPGDERRLFAEAQSSFLISHQNTANELFKQRFLEYASGEVLDAHGENENCPRLPKEKATTIQRFHLDAPIGSNVIIPEETRVTADSEKYFATKEVAVITAGNTYVDIEVEATEGGESYNGFAKGLISSLVDQVPYVSKTENLEVTAGGDNGEPYPEEDGGVGDEHYRERIKLARSSKSTAGAISTYEYYAKSADASIKDVKVVSPNPCYIDIYVLLEDGKIPDAEMLQKVEQACTPKEHRPLGDRVKAVGVEPITYDIELVYYTTLEEESAVVEATEGAYGAIERYKQWQGEKIGRMINPDRLKTEICKSENKPIGAEYVQITSPAFQTLTQTQIAQWSGTAKITHQLIDATETNEVTI